MPYLQTQIEFLRQKDHFEFRATDGNTATAVPAEWDASAVAIHYSI